MAEDQLNFAVFVALAAVGWADGKLDPAELEAILRIAEESGLAPDQLSALSSVISGPVSVDLVDVSELSQAEALFAYAAAAWITRLDGRISESEVDLLSELGDALSLALEQRIQVDGISRDIAELPSGERPARYELAKLRQMISERLVPRFY